MGPSPHWPSTKATRTMRGFWPKWFSNRTLPDVGDATPVCLFYFLVLNKSQNTNTCFCQWMSVSIPLNERNLEAPSFGAPPFKGQNLSVQVQIGVQHWKTCKWVNSEEGGSCTLSLPEPHASKGGFLGTFCKKQAVAPENWATPPVRLGLSRRNSGKIPERPRKHSQSVSWNSPREYGWDAPNAIIQGI